MTIKFKEVADGSQYRKILEQEAIRKAEQVTAVERRPYRPGRWDIKMIRNDLSTLKGKTPVIIRGMEIESDLVEIFFSDLTYLALLHYQDCCEGVNIVDVAGDPKDLIGRHLTICEEVSSKLDPEEVSESGTATWYKFVSMEGSVTLRWLGLSNGYYSEEVSSEIETLENLNDLTDEERVEWDRVMEGIVHVKNW